jgi:hypothetical protein
MTAEANKIGLDKVERKRRVEDITYKSKETEPGGVTQRQSISLACTRPSTTTTTKK